MRAFATLILFGGTLLPEASRAAPAVCQDGAVTPAALRKAAAGVPITTRIPTNVGTRLPPSTHTAPLPRVLGQILPQYPGYRAVRTRRMVAIVNPRTRRVAYLLPLNLASPLSCPSS